MSSPNALRLSPRRLTLGGTSCLVIQTIVVNYHTQTYVYEYVCMYSVCMKFEILFVCSFTYTYYASVFFHFKLFIYLTVISHEISILLSCGVFSKFVYTSRYVRVILEQGHVNLICIVQTLTDEPRSNSWNVVHSISAPTRTVQSARVSLM